MYLLTAIGWQLYNTHLHTNNTQNDTQQTIHYFALYNSKKGTSFLQQI